MIASLADWCPSELELIDLRLIFLILADYCRSNRYVLYTNSFACFAWENEPAGECHLMIVGEPLCSSCNNTHNNTAHREVRPPNCGSDK
jgi:hypothetical protein